MTTPGGDREPYPPPPRTRRARSKACWGAMFYDQRMEDAGVPPWCAGLNYGRSNPPKSDSFDTTDNTTDKLGAFKYVCVGYAERKYPFYSQDEGVKGGVKRGRAEANKLPYCEGLLMLVTDKEGGLENPPRAARSLANQRSEDADEDRNTDDVSTSGDAPDPTGSPLPGLGIPGLSSDRAEARERGRNDRGGDKPIVEPGYVLPSAEFERKFTKSAGKIVKNMKRHVNYIASTVYGAVGGGGGAGTR